MRWLRGLPPTLRLARRNHERPNGRQDANDALRRAIVRAAAEVGRAIMTQLRIFVLKAREDLPNTDNPFRPWYDKTFGVVVRAGSEDSARCLVSEELGPTEGRDVWMLPHYTECLELTGCGESEIILTDFRSA